MKAMVINALSDVAQNPTPLGLQELPEPTPSAREILIDLARDEADEEEVTSRQQPAVRLIEVYLAAND